MRTFITAILATAALLLGACSESDDRAVVVLKLPPSDRDSHALPSIRVRSTTLGSLQYAELTEQLQKANPQERQKMRLIAPEHATWKMVKPVVEAIADVVIVSRGLHEDDAHRAGFHGRIRFALRSPLGRVTTEYKHA